MLHIINKMAVIEDCLNLISSEDALLCIENAVYAATKPHFFPEALLANQSIYALQEDILARGLHNHVQNRINLINYEQFVDLVIAHATTQTWY